MRIKYRERMGVYHCVSRVVGRGRLLGAVEREILRKGMWRVADFCGVEVLTYCILENHFHVLVRSGRAQATVSDEAVYARAEAYYGQGKSLAQKERWAEISRARAEGGEAWAAWAERLRRCMGDVSWFMRLVKQVFSVWYNRRGERQGTLWEGRFCSVLVEDSVPCVAAVAAYIDLNPVRAGVAEDPKDYRFCGYAEALAGGKQSRPKLCQVLEGRDRAAVLARYRSLLFTKGAVERPKKARVDGKAAAKVRAAGGKLGMTALLRHRVRYFTDGAIIGSREFLETWWKENADSLGPKRKQGGHPMKGGDWEGLHSLRNLQRDVLS